jgi:hypothetical protein
MEMSRREMELLERGVTALEKIAEEPVLQTEGGPPICPHCNTLNPAVEIAAAGKSSGPFIEYYVPMRCLECDKSFFAVPLEWATFVTMHDLKDEIQRRAGVLSGNGGNPNG